METITITLDGVEVSGDPGTTVLELAQESGVDIPTLCYDRHLAPFGACRLCLVEDESTKALLASCVTPIRAGMVINTKSSRVLERRKTIVQLMLASHPDSCLVCDKGNRCQLREIAAQTGIGLLAFPRIPQGATIEEVNPFIERDLSKCILCAKCIRADQELVVEGAIDYVGRGFSARPATLNRLPLERSDCTFCGTCVALCPTGALMEKERAYRGTTATTVTTACPYCGCGCSLSLEVKDNRLVRARPGPAPGDRGALCVRGAYGYDFVHSPERLTAPLVKGDGGLQAATWDQALARVAAEFNRIGKEHGPDSLAVLGSPVCTNEENYLLQRLARSVMGTNNVDNGSRLCSAAIRAGLGRTIGFSGSTHSLNELENSNVILLIGADPTSSAPAVGYAVKRASRLRGARLLLVDPRQTKLAGFAHLWLRPRPGSDVALLNAMARTIVDERLYDEEFVSRRTDRFADLASTVSAYTLDRAEQLTGVAGQDIGLAARLLAGAERASIVFGDGLCQGQAGAEAVAALANLAMLTGNIGQHGGGVFALQQEINAQGACDMGALPDFLPGYQSLEDARTRRDFEERWRLPVPTNRGLTALQMIEQAAAGKVRAMLIVGENPVSSLPNPALVRKALASLEFLAVTDLFLTETAQLAAVVLPAASFAEKEGTFTSLEGRVQTVRKAIGPPGQALTDFEIVLRLAAKMGRALPYSAPHQVMNEIRDLVPMYRGPASSDAETDELDVGAEAGYSAARRLHGGLFPSGFARFSPVEYRPPASTPSEDYPLLLLTGSSLPHFGSGTRSSRASRLNRLAARSWIEVGEADARQCGVTDGQPVKVTSPSGAVQTTARVTSALPAGVVFMPRGFRDSPVNELLSFAAEGTGIAECYVRLERITTNG